MKKILLTLALILCIVGISNAQMKQITVVTPGPNNTSTSSFFINLDGAITNASAGSDIIIPGGNYSLSRPIEKELHIYGAGHYPGSSADGKTIIEVDEFLLIDGKNADNTSISGIETRGIYIRNHDESNLLQNVSISRCKINHIQLMGNDKTITNIKVRENVTNVIDGYNIKYNIIEKNIVGEIRNFNYSLIANNIVTGWYQNSNLMGQGIIANYNSLIINNIHSYSGEPQLWYNNNCNIINNVCVGFTPEPSGGSNTFSGNRYSIPLNEIFVEVPSEQFSYDNNYHILSPWTTYAAAYGENEAGKEVGIYGTKYPYKEDGTQPALPVIPNITNANISTQLNGVGKIEVEVSAQAQTK